MGKRGKHERRGNEHLYSPESEKKFEREYGKSRGKRIWRAVVGKVKRERVVKRHYRSKEAALEDARRAQREGKRVRVTRKGLLRKKYTVHERQ